MMPRISSLLIALVSLGHLVSAAGAIAGGLPESALSADDVCSSQNGHQCAFNALQKRGNVDGRVSQATSPKGGEVTTFDDMSLDTMLGYMKDLHPYAFSFPFPKLPHFDTSHTYNYVSVVTEWLVDDVNMTKFEKVFTGASDIAHSTRGCNLYWLGKDMEKRGKYVGLELYINLPSVLLTRWRIWTQKDWAENVTDMLIERPVTHILPLMGSPGLTSNAVNSTVAIVNFIKVKNSTTFEALTLPFINHVHYDEPGNAYFAYGRDVNAENEFISAEMYDSIPAIKEHQKADWTRDYGKAERAQLDGFTPPRFLPLIGTGGVIATQA